MNKQRRNGSTIQHAYVVSNVEPLFDLCGFPTLNREPGTVNLS
jgi:hypothetical protein